MGNNILVSVIVITYNSSKFVLETLDSIKNQTYQNLELIISDDCSKDNTVTLCKDWANQNKNRFARIEIIEVKENTGTSKNINRGCKLAKGEWLKPIAGDDILMPECIEDNIIFIQTSNINFIFSKIKTFGENITDGSIPTIRSDFIECFNNLTNRQQFTEMCFSVSVSAPTAFIKRNVFEKYNFFDESYKLIEDHPTWLKVSLKGEMFHIIDKETVLYRMHNDNVFMQKKIFISDFFLDYRYDIFNSTIKDNVNFFDKQHIKLELIILTIISKTWNNIKLYNLLKLLFIFSPSFYRPTKIIKLKSKLSRIFLINRK